MIKDVVVTKDINIERNYDTIYHFSWTEDGQQWCAAIRKEGPHLTRWELFKALLKGHL